MATVAIGLAAAAGVLTAAALTTAIAAPALPVGTGQFVTWRGAQLAAGFPLLKPTKTDSLARTGDIAVARCEISRKKASKRLVTASYGLTARANLTLTQNNSGAPCNRIGTAKLVGRYRVDGALADLTAGCGRRGLPPCSSVAIFLFLTWRKDGVYYRASSFGEPRSVLLGFARGLVRV
jgi:hypothetical protein